MPSIKPFISDTEKESKGVWIDLGSGLKMLIARADNPGYKAMLLQLLKPHRNKLRFGGELPLDVVEKATQKAIARHILLDWKNLTETDEPDAVEIPYSEAKALELLGIRDFNETIMGYAIDASLYRVEAKELNEGNS